LSADREIDAWLDGCGFELPDAKAKARAALENVHLTRPGKVRISEDKLPRAAEVLAGLFFLYCESPACQAEAAQSGRQGLRTASKRACDGCGGSDNRRAQEAFAERCRQRGVRRLVIVGGSPSVREALGSVLGKAVDLRLVDGTERRTADRAKGDVEWADLVLLWGASELHHKVSTLYTQLPPPLRRKILHVAKRGIAALLAEASRLLVVPAQRGEHV